MTETPPDEPRPLLTIRPPRGRARLNLSEVFQYREIVVAFARREIQLRYRQTALGVVWVVLQPLLSAGIATLIFGRIAGFDRGDSRYFLTAYAGQLAWVVFGLSIFKISTSLVGNAAMLSKVFFPRLTLPLASVVAAQVDFCIGLALLAALLPVYGVFSGVALLTLPLWFLGLALMGLGVGMMAAALMVSYRDVGFVLPVALNAANLLSPVLWPLARLESQIHSAGLQSAYLLLNPVAVLIEGLRWSLLGGRLAVAPGWIAYAGAMSVAICLLGTLVFRQEERRFADVI